MWSFCGQYVVELHEGLLIIPQKGKVRSDNLLCTQTEERNALQSWEVAAELD